MRHSWVSLCLVAWSVSNGALCADRPETIRWDFETEETSKLRSHGNVHRDVPGPRPPIYPDFDSNNTAVKLDGSGAYLSIDDPGADSDFDFTNGDSITLEAWVQVAELRGGDNVYVIGKGRTGSPGFAPDNQNWALRVRETQGKAGISFLFATPVPSDAPRNGSQWHRWTTKRGFQPGKGWHHIAVTYRFGEPNSIRGWIDGQPQEGVWDMGGPTDRAPVVDNDAVWIGTSQGGAAGSSFRGSLDSIAVHRAAHSDAVMKARFRREGAEPVAKPAPEAMPQLSDLPPGQVLVTVHEGMPTHDRWLFDDESLPPETMRWQTENFLLARLPQRYDGWGIRENWKPPVLLRLAGEASLAPGKYRLMMRVRGLARLWVNGEVIARSQPMAPSPNGEEPMKPVPTPPLPGLRLAEHGQRETFGEAAIGPDGKCHVVLETLVGGKALKTDPGETCVAIEADDGKTWLLMRSGALSSDCVVQLTDAEVTRALARQEAALGAFDDQTRRSAARSQDAYWEKRHQAARQWAREQPSIAVPNHASHPIDAFLAAKIERAVSDAAKTPVAEAEAFHSTVLPILRDQCFRCHGDKENGGLRLNSHAAALLSGDSELPAVVPGKPDESELLRRIKAEDPDERMPPGAAPLERAQIATLEAWIRAGAQWPAPPVSAASVAAPPILDDASFLRRVFLDTVGVPPTEREVQDFLSDGSADKRQRMVDRLLEDERWADHWMSYWQDVLAENPTLLNPSLNTTGPFRWFLYEALRDEKPFDRWVTELIMLRGSPHEGGSAGFGIAADNDAPLAAKGQIVASAFLGMELQCARCHDSPYHSTTQRDLYALAAMFERKSVTVPESSSVPAAFFEKKDRQSLIKVTLKPSEPVQPKWPFEAVTGSAEDEQLAASMQRPNDSRERLAALITSPRNTRFAHTIVNRLWQRLLGAGIVEPVDDWEAHEPSHPELLDWLARELVAHDYDLKHVARLILTSQVYQRVPTGKNRAARPELRFFVAPDRRRLSAEQIVDSLVAASGRPLDVEEITFDPDGRRASSNRISLGVPRRAWMLASLANERDRPSLSLPKARAIVDVLEAFGWTGSRQSPRSYRETDPNVLQPGVLANSLASVQLTRAVAGSGLAEMALKATSSEQLVESIFLRYLGRLPTESECVPLVKTLAEGFEERSDSPGEIHKAAPLEPLPRVTWSNHLRPEANSIALELEHRARLGPPADSRLRAEWREAYEDVVWSVINLREFVWMP